MQIGSFKMICSNVRPNEKLLISCCIGCHIITIYHLFYGRTIAVPGFLTLGALPMWDNLWSETNKGVCEKGGQMLNGSWFYVHWDADTLRFLDPQG